MDIKNLQKEWNAFGEKDPLWSILTEENKKNNKWDLKEFFDSGIKEIEETVKKISNPSLKYDAALDFGCGVGRLTNPLGNYFKNVVGVDIAPSMIELANKYKTKKNCNFLVNGQPNLKLFSDNTFDFVYSYITLQHIKPKYSLKYIKELSRVLKPGGTIVFNLPSHFKSLKEEALGLLYPQPIRTIAHHLVRKKTPIMEIYYVKREKIIKILNECRVKLVKSEKYIDGPLVSYEYLGIKEK